MKKIYYLDIILKIYCFLLKTLLFVMKQFYSQSRYFNNQREVIRENYRYNNINDIIQEYLCCSISNDYFDNNIYLKKRDRIILNSYIKDIENDYIIEKEENKKLKEEKEKLQKEKDYFKKEKDDFKKEKDDFKEEKDELLQENYKLKEIENIIGLKRKQNFDE